MHVKQFAWIKFWDMFDGLMLNVFSCLIPYCQHLLSNVKVSDITATFLEMQLRLLYSTGPSM